MTSFSVTTAPFLSSAVYPVDLTRNRAKQGVVLANFIVVIGVNLKGTHEGRGRVVRHRFGLVVWLGRLAWICLPGLSKILFQFFLATGVQTLVYTEPTENLFNFLMTRKQGHSV